MPKKSVATAFSIPENCGVEFHQTERPLSFACRLPPMSRTLSLVAILFSIFLVLAVFGGLVWANTLYVRAQPAEKQFLVPWLAARTYLTYGLSPYDEAAAQRAQIVYYGRLAAEDEDPLRLAIPLPVVFVYFPFAFLNDYALARGLWMTLGEMALAATALLTLSLTGWKPRRFLIPLVILFGVLSVYAFIPLRGGGPAPFVALGLLGALAALRAERDETAGALLALSLLEPRMAPVFLLFLFWRATAQRRWRVWFGFLMTAGFFTLLAFLLIPSWFLPYLRNAISHSRYDPGVSVAALLADWWPAFGLRLSLGLTALLGLFLFLEWRALPGKDFRHVLWTASLTLAVGPLLGLPVALDGHLLLLLPLILLLAVAAERWRGARAAFVSGGILVALFALLWLAAGSLHALFLLPPFLLLIGLYWMRWWAIRPPRTWVETLPR